MMLIPAWLLYDPATATAYPAEAAVRLLARRTLQRAGYLVLEAEGPGEALRIAQRQGSSVWVGSVEARIPIARRLNLDAVDHVVGLRNVYLAGFYDVGDAYTRGKQVGPIAHGLGAGLRLDVSWISFVERTTLRFDVAKSVNTDTGVQVWFGINQPF